MAGACDVARVLVTGAGGFIGSHLTEALVRSGEDVVAHVEYNSLGSRGWLDETPTEVQDSVEYFSGDIRDPYATSAALRGVDTVFHLAALIAIPHSYRSPHSYVETNVIGTLNVLQGALERDVSRIIHTSTSEVYGSARFVPITEEHPLQGQSPYSASKIGADQLAFSFHRSFGAPVTIVRPFNTYGPRQSARAVIPTIITQIAAGKKSIHLGSTEPTRDFSFVMDIVEGFLSASRTDGSDGEVVNLGSNFEIAVGDLVHEIAALMDSPVEIVTDELRVRPPLSEVERLWASNYKAAQLLRWRPAYAGLDGLRRGLASTIEWFIDPANRSAYRVDGYAV